MCHLGWCRFGENTSSSVELMPQIGPQSFWMLWFDENCIPMEILQRLPFKVGKCANMYSAHINYNKVQTQNERNGKNMNRFTVWIIPGGLHIDKMRSDIYVPTPEKNICLFSWIVHQLAANFVDVPFGAGQAVDSETIWAFFSENCSLLLLEMRFISAVTLDSTVKV